uniref:Chitin-binding type-2 domain-containing protein n=1 Tax=Glossina brevipalpis TaxID=37001 RepID=A0A1A9WRJ0_9MUSC
MKVINLILSTVILQIGSRLTDTVKAEYPNFKIICENVSSGTFLPHKDDCTRFMRCFMGKPFEFRCFHTFRWNPNTQSCVPANATDCLLYSDYDTGKFKTPVKETMSISNTIMETEDSNDSNDQSSTESDKPENEKVTKQLPENEMIVPQNDDETQVTSSPDASESENLCANTTDGTFLPHATDCKLFVKCSHDEPHEFHCPKTFIWDQSRLSCIFEDLIPCLVYADYDLKILNNEKSLVNNHALDIIVTQTTPRTETLTLAIQNTIRNLTIPETITTAPEETVPVTLEIATLEATTLETTAQETTTQEAITLQTTIPKAIELKTSTTTLEPTKSTTTSTTAESTTMTPAAYDPVEKRSGDAIATQSVNGDVVKSIIETLLYLARQPHGTDDPNKFYIVYRPAIYHIYADNPLETNGVSNEAVVISNEALTKRKINEVPKKEVKYNPVTTRPLNIKLVNDDLSMHDVRLPRKDPRCNIIPSAQLPARHCSQFYQCSDGYAFLLNCQNHYKFDSTYGKCIRDSSQQCW